jgi:hypothetical protein
MDFENEIKQIIIGSGRGPMAGNETSGFVQRGEFLD